MSALVLSDDGPPVSALSMAVVVRGEQSAQWRGYVMVVVVVG